MVLRPLASARFQALFHSPPGVLPTFPSRYWYTIGLTGVFSLAGWARRIRAGLLVSRVTQDHARIILTSHTGLSPPMVLLSRRFRSSSSSVVAFLQPRSCLATATVWALPRSLAATGGIISLFSLPPGTKMFQFPGFAPARAGARPSAVRVAPFGHVRINSRLQIPGHFRSLPRPSSPAEAKASSVRSDFSFSVNLSLL